MEVAYIDSLAFLLGETTRVYFVLSVILFGFYTLSPNRFGRVVIWILFSMFVNVTLKHCFAMPLPPTVDSDSYAFPSGHMQMACMFWGGLLLEMKQKRIFGIFAAVILPLVGWSMVYKGYHYTIDIIGAFAVSCILLTLAAYLRKRSTFQARPFLLGYVLAGVSIPMILYVPWKASTNHIFMAFGGLIGFPLGWALYNKAFPDAPKRLQLHTRLGLALVMITFALLLNAYFQPIIKGNAALIFFFSLALDFFIAGGPLALFKLFIYKRQALGRTHCA